MSKFNPLYEIRQLPCGRPGCGVFFGMKIHGWNLCQESPSIRKEKRSTLGGSKIVDFFGVYVFFLGGGNSNILEFSPPKIWGR